MTFVLVVMLASMFTAWYGYCWRWRKGADLKSRLAGVRAEVLAGCAIVFTSLMPALRFAVAMRLEVGWWVVPALLGLEAAICLLMELARGKLYSRTLDEWRSRAWENALRHDLV